MELDATIRDGVAVHDESCPLPEGTRVKVVEAKPMHHALLELARRIAQEPCDLPEDLSTNHDYYLYGGPKKS